MAEGDSAISVEQSVEPQQPAEGLPATPEAASSEQASSERPEGHVEADSESESPTPESLPEGAVPVAFVAR